MDLGGAETFAMHAYRSVNRDNLQFDFAVSAAKKCDYDDEILALGGRIIRHTQPAKAGFRHYGAELTNILRQYGPFCAVHSHLQYFSGFIMKIAAREKVPVRIAHFHSTRDARSGSLQGFVYHAAMRWLIRRFATHILGCGGKVLDANFGARWVADPRITVMSNGIALAPYSAACPDREELYRRFSVPVAGCVLGHIGRFDRFKNHAFLIEVLRSYLKVDPNANLVLVGDGELRAEIERQVGVLGLSRHVHFLGKRPQSDVPKLLAAFDALVMPSIYEGLPVTLVEAQAAGVPCVVSDAVTKEADLNLGLMRFIDLQRSPEDWSEQIRMAMRTSRPDWHDRRNALRVAGYDIAYSANALARIYCQGN